MVLSNGKRFGQTARPSDDMGAEEFWTRTCPKITSFKYLKHLLRYSKCRDLHARFLVNGNMTLVQRTVVELKSPGSRYYHVNCGHMRDAIMMSLNEDLHERVVDLLEAARERYALGNEQHDQTTDGFKGFLYSFFRVLVPEENSMPLKRFLTLYGEKFKERCLNVFKIFCQELVSYLKNRLHISPSSRQLMGDLIAQPSLLTPDVFVKGFLNCESDFYRYNFILCNWREAISEALKMDYDFGNKLLWNVMVSKFTGKFYGEYPCTDEARTFVIRQCTFPKEYLEEAWAKKNAPKLLKRLMELLPNLLLPVLWNIIAQYAVTLISD